MLNVSFYRFVVLENLIELQAKLKARLASIGTIRGTILLAEEGINGFLAGPDADLRGFLAELCTIEPFRGLDFKESFSTNVPFKRALVKIKKEIIAMGHSNIKPIELTGPRVEPEELKQWLEKEPENIVLIDTRNDYETGLGTFKNAVDWKIKTFRQFPEKLADHRKDFDGKKVVMFCTGGIRCEKATAYALQIGMKDVYQLEGGILRYFEKVGGDHYDGECFVFDHRVSVDSKLETTPTALCFACRHPLTVKDQNSPCYIYEVQCPYCSPLKSHRETLQAESAPA